MNFPDLPESIPWWADVIIVVLVSVTILVAGLMTLMVKRTGDDIESNKKKLQEYQELFDKAALEHETFRSTEKEIKELLEKSITAVDSIRLADWRAELFLDPRSREHHEHLLDVGDQYIKAGGNGSGRVRLNQLTENYEHLLENNDWDYRPEVVHVVKKEEKEK